MMAAQESTSITIRFTQEELDAYRTLREHFAKWVGIDISRHRWLKTAIERGCKQYAEDLAEVGKG